MNKRNALTTAALGLGLAIAGATASIAAITPAVTSMVSSSVVEEAHDVINPRPGATTFKGTEVDTTCDGRSDIVDRDRFVFECAIDQADETNDRVDNTYDYARSQITVVSSRVKDSGRTVGTMAREIAAQTVDHVDQNVNDAACTVTGAAGVTVSEVASCS